MPFALTQPTPSSTADPAEQPAAPAPTAPVSVMPNPADPSEITRYSATVPFGEKGSFVASDQVVYNFGTTAVSDELNTDVIYQVPLRGTVRYPDRQRRYARRVQGSGLAIGLLSGGGVPAWHA